MSDDWAKDPRALSDDEARYMALKIEMEMDDGPPVFPSQPDGIRRFFERAHANNDLNHFLKGNPDEPNDLTAEERARAVADIVHINRRDHDRQADRAIARTAAGKAIRRTDLAELFIDDPAEAARIWDALHGDGA